MEENKGYSYDGKLLAKNTIYNLLGYGLPLLLALIIIPPLIKNLGVERFAILNLCWIVVGYFSFLDFGIGKALTKIIAEKIGSKQHKDIPHIFWTSLMVMLIFSTLASVILYVFVPELLKIFEVSPDLYLETKSSFYVLVIAIPIVTSTAGLRGVLEAYQEFGTINLIRILMGVFTFLGPLIVFMFTKSLYWIVIFLVMVRALVWLIYLIHCFRINVNIKSHFKISIESIKPVLKFSIWITLANLIGPIILYSDRVIIGALVKVAAITYYSTPYEVITKLMIIPTSLVGVLFPVFSSSYFVNPDLSKKYLIIGMKIIFLAIYPIIFIIVMFSYEAMDLWLGKTFADNGSRVLQFLSIGIMMNALSLITNNCLQGIGKPRIPTLINLVEFPIYITVMWLLVKSYGIQGAAIAYMLMATLDVILMYTAAQKVFFLKFEQYYFPALVIFFIALLSVPFLISTFLFKVFFTVIIILTFLILTWNYLLNEKEKYFLISKLRMLV
ncbi:MAG: flippase [Ignavibacteriaceae bacterium]|nr:flippase [Ignavibacteriaceae bacterium]